jgi:aminopeptidase N
LPNGKKAFEWFVHYPINSYNVTVNVADYVHIADSLQGVLGNLAIDYYVLRYNEHLAIQHFKQVPGMLRCFERTLGPYPFYRDGYALVETPYWGMEHQGAIAYGNSYRNNDYGFDFIIVHESGHEWFGNNISMSDHADMWIHESFTTYTEFLYLECIKDYHTAVRYLKEQRMKIVNSDAMQGPRGVNFDKYRSADMYYKGAWMLHTLRNVVNDDTKWFKMLRGTWDYFRLKTIATEDMVNYINQQLEGDYTNFFRQYLFYAKPPSFEYTLKKRGSNYILSYRWSRSGDPNFDMPVDYIDRNGVRQRLYPTTATQTIVIQDIESIESFKLYLDGFYILVSPMDRLD